MMLVVFVLSATLVIGALELPQIPVLDFTVAPPVGRVDSAAPGRPGIVAGRPRQIAGGTSSNAQSLTLTFNVALTTKSSGTCGVGEELIYDVELTNTGLAPVVVPWSTFESDEEPDPPPSGYRRLFLALMTERSKNGPTVVGHVQIATGSDLSPGSLRVVAPGERVILRAPGMCPALSDISAGSRTASAATASIFASVMIQTKPGHTGPMARSTPVKLTTIAR